ncbi:peroxidase 43-like [Nicotiana tabacum]|uniref:Peroxidase n=3 Tax=Nicotiana TaxID=4085 RepID=A0A1S3XSX7_TOBAC|nr:PREDICTED: peroxidase 43-like isoform X1 [Nicotiana sylvestris]XP_016442787.1 PREDICTED: peroxidase 43-like isoform X1 [Nicotiana tabacum]
MVLVFFIVIFSYLAGISQGQLRVGFYESTCPNVEPVVSAVVREVAASNQNIAPVLLRLHFHDCFVQGCDGSILIDNGENAERHAFGHQGVGGFEVIERAKAQVEAMCPGVVSCADIVALAARDAVVLANGPSYEVETGRRDGVISNLSLAENMPDVSDSIQILKAKFSDKGLSEKDLVVLSAAHTIGTTACFFMTKRLYNFFPGGGSDPSINPSLLPELMATCPQNGNVNVRLPIDEGSSDAFDNQILQNIRSGFAVLRSDASLYEDVVTRSVVDSYFGMFSPFLGISFEADFANAMVKMGRIDVLTGFQGTIRRVCSAF